jgi:hypothetical protein
MTLKLTRGGRIRRSSIGSIRRGKLRCWRNGESKSESRVEDLHDVPASRSYCTNNLLGQIFSEHHSSTSDLLDARDFHL